LSTVQAANKPPKGAAKEGKTKMKRICIEEHWANKEMLGWRAEWLKRTGFPLTMDPKATPEVFPGLADFEKIRLPLMDESGIAMQNEC
jgi:hypothetical protein